MYNNSAAEIPIHAFQLQNWHFFLVNPDGSFTGKREFAQVQIIIFLTSSVHMNSI